MSTICNLSNCLLVCILLTKDILIRRVLLTIAKVSVHLAILYIYTYQIAVICY